MANIIPPLVSDSPPPPPSEDDEDDEFDEFRGSNDISYGCDSLSLTPSPEQSPKKVPKEASSASEHEFNFSSVTPETGQENTKHLHIDQLKLKETNREDSNQTVDVVPVEQSLKQNNSELSISESLDKVKVEITTKVLHKNNYNKDNIPSQFIIESHNVKCENEISNCDNKNEKLENKPELHNIDSNMPVVETKLPNGFVDLEKFDGPNFSESTPTDRPISNNSEFTLQDTWSANFLSNEINGLELPVSRDSPIDNSKCNEKSEEFTDFSKSITDDLKKETEAKVDSYSCSNDNELNDFSNFSSNLAHSIQNNINNDLVKKENVELSSTTDKKVDSTLNPDMCCDNEVTMESTSNNFNDDFGTFVSHHVDLSNKSKEIELENEEFASFNFHSVDDLKPQSQYKFSNNDIEVKNDDFSDFSSFTDNPQSGQSPKTNVQEDNIEFNAFSSKDAAKKSEKENESESASFAIFPTLNSTGNFTFKNDDEFDDFTSFPVDLTENEGPQISDDDFDDFGEFTSTTSQSPLDTCQKTEPSKPFLLIDEKEAFKKTEEIIKDIFVAPDEILDDFQYFELGKGDTIFTQLQDITDTPALGYIWSKSTSQRLLLKSLNIDSRNILFGHSWNSSMPRFAANLGVQPLEPVKMEPLTPTPAEPVPPIIQSSQPEVEEVPSAEFDWNSSGLVNPLDYCQTTLLDLEQLVASLDIPNTNPTQQNTINPTIDYEDWDAWLKYSPSKSATQSTKSVHPSQPDNDDYEEFTSFQSSNPPAGWPSVPLRETYISEFPQAHIDIDVVLQPTIVTPELPRKNVSPESVSRFAETPPEIKNDDMKQDEDEEFDDFQMVCPGDKNLHESDKSGGIATVNDTVINNSVLEKESKQEIFDTIPFEAPKDTTINFESKDEVIENADEDDDDFTEFHSSAPLPQQIQPQTQATTISVPILQPTQMYSVPNSTEINWPDPGITHDELKRFEEVFSLPSAPKKEEKVDIETKISETVKIQPVESKDRNNISIWDSPPRSNPIKKSEIKEPSKKIGSKQSSFEDEEWSDFVSVQKPSPIHKTKLLDRNQTSSPDLPLSVLNLGSIQPTKQPIPVITPQGLVQTKLSTNMNPTSQPKTMNARPSYDLPTLQPSIISNQYASQAYGFGAAKQSSQVVLNGQEDDEWGEFVSSPLPPQHQNSSTTVGHHSWNNFVSNLGHSSHNSHASRSANTGSQKRNSHLSGLVLPELDFLALKERTGVTRKK